MNLKRFLATGIVSGALLVTGLSAAPPALADGPAMPQNPRSMQCLADSPEGVRMKVCGSESWDRVGDEFRSHANGNCLDDSDEFGLRVIPCNGSTYQKWEVTPNLSRDFHIIRNLQTHRCVTQTNWDEAGSRPCDGSEDQNFFATGETW